MLSAAFLLMNIIILSTIYTEVEAPLMKKFIKKADCYWTDLWVCLLLQCLSIRRQSTVHSAAAFPLGCTSQAKVAAWLQSSDDMDKCSKGETTALSFMTCGVLFTLSAWCTLLSKIAKCWIWRPERLGIDKILLIPLFFFHVIEAPLWTVLCSLPWLFLVASFQQHRHMSLM